MSAPILATKFQIPPPRLNVIFRPRLIERLNEALRRTPGVTLISAPAGFGKTTLVSEWAAGCERPIAWLSLDEGDSDPVRFLTYLVAALQRVAPKIGQGVAGLLQSPQPPPIDAMLTALLNELATVSDAFALVLDDYHAIESKSIDQALAFLLENLLPQMHLVIVTREDPALSLGRLRAYGQLTELRAADLRFTLAEAAGFLKQVMGLNLSEADIAALETRTEGWIAGLQLAAISMRGHTDITRFIQSFTGSHRFVMDYLVEEVLQQQSESLQAFLLQTSILDRLIGPLCEAVLLAPAGSGEMTLEYLERANLLVLPLDDKHEWYRYHPLFADVLHVRLMREQPDEVPGLHRRASAWCEQNNFPAEAIQHALAARDFERAADLIERERAASRGTYFQSATWLGWVKALPDELVRARLMLSIGFAWELLFLGELEAAGDRLRDADRLLAERPANIHDPSEVPSANRSVDDEAKMRSQPAYVDIAWAFQAQSRGDAAGTEKHARQALSLLSETDYYPRGLASALLSLACLTNGDLETAYQYMADGMACMRTIGSLLFATSGTFVLASIRVTQGRLLAAARIYEQALQLVAGQSGPLLQTTAELYLGLSELHHERGDAEAAQQHLAKSEEIGRKAALSDWRHRLCLAQARVKEDQGDFDGALGLLEEAERLYYRTPLPNVRPIAALKARVWIRQGRLTEALGWAQARGLSVHGDLSYLREFEHVTLARALIARYKRDRAERSFQEAVGLLERLLKAAEEGGRLGSAIEILALEALAYEAQGNIPLALATLERALILAEPEGYVRVFVNEGGPMAELLTRLKDESPKDGLGVKEYIHKLLAAFGTQKEVQPFGSAPPAGTTLGPQPLVEPLSQRELEILRLIAQGLSNQEISERLFLALSTVKGHNQIIFAKLQVGRRTEAVARARELGLL